MTLEDIYTTLQSQSMITTYESPVRPTPFRKKPGRGRPSSSRLTPRRSKIPSSSQSAAVPDNHLSHHDDTTAKIEIPTEYSINFDRQYVEAYLKRYESKEYLKLVPDRLKYTPFLVSRIPERPVGAIGAMMGGGIGHGAVTTGGGMVTMEGDDASFFASGSVNGTQDSGSGHVNLENDMDPGRQGETDTVSKVAKGEDEDTLALVAALAADSSPKRNLRKRQSSEIVSDTIDRPKRNRSMGSGSVYGSGLVDLGRDFSPRRSLRGGKSLKTIHSNNDLDHERDTPRKARNGSLHNDYGNGNGNGTENGHRHENDQPNARGDLNVNGATTMTNGLLSKSTTLLSTPKKDKIQDGSLPHGAGDRTPVHANGIGRGRGSGRKMWSASRRIILDDDDDFGDEDAEGEDDDEL